MAESDNILTKLQDLLVYLIPQLNKFPRDQKFVLGDRIETKLLAVQEDCLRACYGRDKRGQGNARRQYLERKPAGRSRFPVVLNGERIRRSHRGW